MTTGSLLIANRYRVLGLLGEGGMGKVLRVEDTTNGQVAAMKVVAHSPRGTRPSRATIAEGAALTGQVGHTGQMFAPGSTGQIGMTAPSPEKSLLQFQQEFRLMTRLRHPNCCTVYDYGTTDDGAPYFTMEVVPGLGLDEMGILDPERFVDLFAQLMRALDYVHQQGLLHKDIKSANVRVTPEGVVKLMDFGLMEYAGRSGAPISGTPAYLAPEIIRRGPIDRRADLYASGVLAYEMLTGQLPFVREKTVELLMAHTSQMAIPPSRLRDGIPLQIERMVMKLLAKEPIARYQSAADALAAMGVSVPPGLGGTLLMSPLVGRDGEVERLQQSLDALTARLPTPGLWLWGEAGVGKSRLLDELRFAAQLSSLPIAIGGCRERGATPYGPFVTLLGRLLPALRAHARAELAAAAPVLVKLLPELGVSPAADLDPPSKEKQRLHATLGELLETLAGRRGLVMVLEDWHWADPSSRELLEHLLRALANAPAFLLATSREEVGPEAMARLALQPLDGPAVASMAAAMLGSEDIAPNFVLQLAELTAGNPFHVERLLEHLERAGVLARLSGRWSTDVAIDREALPAGLQGLLAASLARLPADAITLARAATMIGREFGLELIQRVTGMSNEALFDALERLERAQILAQDEGSTYRFVQEQLRSALYDTMDEDARVGWHVDIARALAAEKVRDREASTGPLNPRRPLGEWLITAARHGRDLPVDIPLERLAALATHALAAAERDPQGDLAVLGAAAALAAGRRSAQIYANEQAERLLAAAHAIWCRPGANAPEAGLLAVLMALADVRRMSGGYDAAKPLYEEAITMAIARGDAGLEALLYTSLARLELASEHLDLAEAAATRGHAAAVTAGDDAEAARALISRGRAHFFRGTVEPAIADAEAALALARRCNDRAKLAEALALGGFLHASARTARADQGRDGLYESIAIFIELGDQLGLNTALDFLGNAQLSAGDYREAKDTFQQKQTIVLAIGYRDDESIGLANLAQIAYELADFDGTIALAREAAALARALDSGYALAMAVALEAAAQAYQGDLAGLRVNSDAARAIARELQNKYLDSQILPYLMEAHLFLGHLQDARAMGEELERLLVDTGLGEVACMVDALMAETLSRLGEPDLARVYLDRALAGDPGARGMRVRALKAKALVSIGTEAWEDAQAAAKEGLALSYRVGVRFRTAELLGLLGECALATGETPTPHPFQAMAEIADELHHGVLEALAHFGLAGATPYGPRAADHVKQAQALLMAFPRGGDGAATSRFFAPTERQRVVTGNHIAFSLAKAAKKPTPPSLGMNQGLWKMGM